MLPDAASAQALAFLHLGDTPGASRSHPHRLRARPCPRHTYRSLTSPTLAADTMTTLLAAVTTANNAALRRRLTDYDGFPPPPSSLYSSCSTTSASPSSWPSTPLGASPAPVRNPEARRLHLHPGLYNYTDLPLLPLPKKENTEEKL
jgi:hypothetical protein